MKTLFRNIIETVTEMVEFVRIYGRIDGVNNLPNCQIVSVACTNRKSPNEPHAKAPRRRRAHRSVDFTLLQRWRMPRDDEY